MIFHNWQVFWLALNFTFPSRLARQWHEVVDFTSLEGMGYYSYGDSAGLSPDFPF
jgi:hypothetical protein